MLSSKYDQHSLSLLARRHRHDRYATRLDVRRVEHRHVLGKDPWPVEHVQVEVVHLELMEGVVERSIRLVVAHVPLCFPPMIVLRAVVSELSISYLHTSK